MKKSYYFLSALLVLAMSFTGCKKTDPPVDPVDPETRNLVIDVTTEVPTKAITDAAGFVWQASDADKLGIVTATKLYKSSSVMADGAKAAFNAEVAFDASDIYLFYPYAAEQTNKAAKFAIPATRTQSRAGELAGDAIALVGKSVVRLGAETDKEPDKVSATMTPLASILKVLVYSSDPNFQTEKLESITLTASTAINGELSYDLSKSELKVATEGTKEIEVLLANPFALKDSNSKETASGVYFTVLPGVTTTGYKYTVESDIATYTFETENSKTFDASTILIEGLDLAKASSRIDGTTPVVTYDITGLNTTVDFEVTGGDIDAGTFVASLDGTVKTDYDAEYYASVTVEKDANWLTAVIEDNHLKLTATENNAADNRSCKIKLVYTPKEYVIASRLIAEITVNQKCPAKNLTYVGSIENKTVDSGASAAPVGLGYWYATVEGEGTKEHSTNPEFYDNCTFTVVDEDGNPVTWLTCVYRANDTWWDVTYEANPETELRTAYITATFAPVDGYNITNPEKTGVTFTQKGKSTTGVPEITYEGNLVDEYTVGGDMRGWYNLGWWYAMVSDGGVTLKHETFPADAFYYSDANTTATITDDSEEHNPVEWIRLRRPENSSHWDVQYDANETDETRTAIITVTYNIPGHACTNPVKTIRFSQRSLNAPKVLTYVGDIAGSYNIPYSANEKIGLSWWYATVDGLTKEHAISVNSIYYDNCTFTITDEIDKAGNQVDWCTCKYRDYDTWWDISVTENPYNVARTCYITADFAEIDGHLLTNPVMSTIIVQAANPNGVDPE